MTIFYGWVVWTAVTIGMTTVFLGASSGVTFVVDPVKDELGLTQTSVALAYTLGTVFSALAQIPMGRSVDRWGGRVGVTVYSAAYFFSVAGLALPRSWIALAVSFGFIRALGVGGMETACNTTLQQWFSRRRGLATGLSQSINALLSYAVLSNVDAVLVSTYGFRRTYAFAGLSLLVTYTPLAYVFLRSRPEDMGLKPDGEGTAQQRCSTRTAETIPESTAALEPADEGEARAPKESLESERAAPCGTDLSFTLAEAARTRTLVLLASGNALAWGVGSGLFFNLSSITREAGLPAAQLAPCLYVPWAICRSLGMLSAGYLVDHLPPRFLLCGGLTLAAAGILILAPPWGTLTPTLAALFGVLHGFGNGATSLVFRAAPAIFFGRTHVGAIGGLLSMLNVGSTAIGPLLVGGSFDAFGSYAQCVRGIAGCTGAFALLSLAMHPPVRATPPTTSVETSDAVANAKAARVSAPSARAGRLKGVPVAMRGRTVEKYAELDEEL